LTESQARRLAVTLADLERRLAALRDTLEHPPGNLRLSVYEDRLRAQEAEALRRSVRAANKQVGAMADRLGLRASAESVRRAFLAGLELASIALDEARPSGGLRGCGEVAPATAAYLEAELPRLDASVREIIGQLQSGVWGESPAD
jgi:hypothetical protein